MSRRSTLELGSPVVVFCMVLTLVGCSDPSRNHVPGVYTGSFTAGPSTGEPVVVVVGETDITRAGLTVRIYTGSSFSRITFDSTGSWPLTWNERDSAYDYSMSLAANDRSVSIEGVVGIDTDKKPTVHGSVTVDTSESAGKFYLYLEE